MSYVFVTESAQKKAMRKVSGTLRIDLAQYQELESFAQFGSELDKESQAQLSRGQRLRELLKQPQYSPMQVWQQVVSLYAGTKGYMDNVEVSNILTFQDKLLAYIKANNKDIIDEITKTGLIEEGTEEKLKKAIETFKPIFKESNNAK